MNRQTLSELSHESSKMMDEANGVDEASRCGAEIFRKIAIKEGQVQFPVDFGCERQHFFFLRCHGLASGSRACR